MRGTRVLTVTAVWTKVKMEAVELVNMMLGCVQYME
jgi:hypothetical protein